MDSPESCKHYWCPLCRLRAPKAIWNLLAITILVSEEIHDSGEMRETSQKAQANEQGKVSYLQVIDSGMTRHPPGCDSAVADTSFHEWLLDEIRQLMKSASHRALTPLEH